MSLAFSPLCPLIPLPGKSLPLLYRVKSYPSSYEIFSNSFSSDVPLHICLYCFGWIVSSMLVWIISHNWESRKHAFLILAFWVLCIVLGTHEHVEWMNVYHRMEGTKSKLGISYNSVFPTLTEIDLLWNVYYLAAEFRLGEAPRNCYTSQMVIWKGKITAGSLFSYLIVAQ